MSNFFYEQFSWAVSNFFADVSSKIIALADPVLSQPDIEREMVSPPAGAYIPSFTICHVLSDLPATVVPNKPARFSDGKWKFNDWDPHHTRRPCFFS